MPRDEAERCRLRDIEVYNIRLDDTPEVVYTLWEGTGDEQIRASIHR